MESISEPCILSIAGSDSCGGAGIQVDARVAQRLGVYTMVAVTAVTAQNRSGLHRCVPVDSDIIKQQIECAATHMPISAIKTGLISTPAALETIAESISSLSLPKPVVDPVIAPSLGVDFASDRLQLANMMMRHLIPKALITTPNFQEALFLCGLPQDCDISPLDLGYLFIDKSGCNAVLIKGGHIPTHDNVTDTLFFKDNHGAVHSSLFTHPRIQTNNTHGTGCALSAAIASFVAKGNELDTSVRKASECIAMWLREGASDSHGSACGIGNPDTTTL